MIPCSKNSSLRRAAPLHESIEQQLQAITLPLVRPLDTVRQGGVSSIRLMTPDDTRDVPFARSNSAAWEPGSLIDGTYRIIRELGQGSMGRVLLARDELLDRDVAIKLFPSTLLVTPLARRRFIDEARAMARVHHENVVTVFAFDESDAGPFFVMEYVPGPSLAQWLAGSKIVSLDEALGVLSQLCEGVQAIHDAGAIHRDLKPANILIGPGYRIAVADLGLARIVAQASPSKKLSSSHVGTPWYMAPEVIVGETISPELAARIDIYSLGVIAFQMLTGELPFKGATLPAVLQQHLSKEPPRPSDVRPDLPETIDAPVLATLEKRAVHRPSSARWLAEALRSARRGIGPLQRRVRILVADDDRVFLRYVEAILMGSYPDAEIEAVADGAAALEALERQPTDIAVLDLDMPKLNAIELTASIQGLDSSRRPRVVIVTAAGGPEDWDVLVRLHAEAFILKPVEPNRLVETVGRLLADRH